ncbi:(2Fe-2S)-binding protein [Salinicola corii]|uniref:Bacterioferritin-associated ferredoxin n=1 Tax=Salinicola corii TaxID=2606937 RepID=A0A640WIL3_9GAMM|nr:MULTISPECIES: (2Fe-2S)-binding protein [Salinicola]KAA0020469.1 (2Fe-2S)-binding protein [Salinicola corii]MAM59640.1 (2Fe-2S)-binding protein [Salinicola sp.]NRB55818.1 (2Fe-2S)-binding protein [Salinicola sp.]
MYVCLCVGVTDRDIENAVSSGARSWREVREATGCAGQCGKCACTGKSVMREAISQEMAMDPDLAYAV